MVTELRDLVGAFHDPVAGSYGARRSGASSYLSLDSRKARKARSKATSASTRCSRTRGCASCRAAARREAVAAAAAPASAPASPVSEARDEIVLALGHRDEAKVYGQTILKLLEGLPRRSNFPGMVGILEDKREAEARIRQIASYKRSNKSKRALGLCLFSMVALVGLTNAQTPEDTPRTGLRPVSATGGRIPAAGRRGSRGSAPPPGGSCRAATRRPA